MTFSKIFWKHTWKKRLIEASYMDHIHMLKIFKWICSVYQMNLELLTLEIDYKITYFDEK